MENEVYIFWRDLARKIGEEVKMNKGWTITVLLILIGFLFVISKEENPFLILIVGFIIGVLWVIFRQAYREKYDKKY